MTDITAQYQKYVVAAKNKISEILTSGCPVQWFWEEELVEKQDVAKKHMADGKYHILYKRYDYAVEELNKAIDIYLQRINNIQPANPSDYKKALENRVECFIELKSFSLAIKDYDSIIELERVKSKTDVGDMQKFNLYTAIGKRARLFYDNKEYQKAIDDYTEAINTANSFSSTDLIVIFFGDLGGINILYSGRAAAYSSLTKHKEAIQDYSTALASEIKYTFNEGYHANLYVKRAIEHLLLADENKCIDDLAAGGELFRALGDEYKDSLVNCLINRGVVLSGKSRFDEAIKDYDEAIAISNEQPHGKGKPDLIRALEARSKCFEFCGNMKRSKDDFNEAQRLKQELEK